MRTLRDFFNRAPPPTPRTQDSRIEAQTLDKAPASSPQSELPRSSITIDLTQDDDRKNEEDISALTRQDISPPRLASDNRPEKSAPDHSFLGIESIPPPSSLNGSFNASQRILKDGQEVVISSDGDDTDSISSLEDPDLLFAPKNKPKNAPPPPPKKYQPNKALLAQLSAPTKYKYTIDSLVHDAVDDDEIEANVAKARATVVELQQNGVQGAAGGLKNGLNEGTLASALGGDSDQGPGLQRLFDAVRRTEALEQNRTWRFFDYSQMMPATPKFPRKLFPAGSPLAGLTEPESRARILQSGILEFAASLRRLPDEFLLWLIRSIPHEPKEELRKAYCRIFTQTPQEQAGPLICRDEIDGLFRQLGAKPRALDLSEPIIPDPPESSLKAPHNRERSALVSVLNLIRDTAAAELFDDDTQEHAIQILLRMSIDTSLTTDCVVRSELQGTLTSLLEFGPKERIERNICTTIYETIKDPQFQSRLLQHILPTSTWVSLLRYRLAVSFLLKKPGPFTDSPKELLSLKRITRLLMRDERFQVRGHRGNSEYDYGDLVAIILQLEVCINSALFDLEYRQADTVVKFNEAIDQLAAQIKWVFSSIENTGASHLQRLVARDMLEALHYRMVYSVRSKAPPKKTPFEIIPNQTNHTIPDMFTRNRPINTGDGAADAAEIGNVDGTAMPIRGHDQES
ncbi:uncharacterized protein N7473_005146 [Penicillium subrubescens]|uniref:uncharacterized protein n=1 Tax=Penicillium subrubescens TaxID=1316194 RepID=UPI00254521D6|nr:uncharacterized protein N7473_005146 [Penicillium subrubescens]KAJ5895747.1 hypothetical protein N7473_005146 [Penicillium subrubescens]